MFYVFLLIVLAIFLWKFIDSLFEMNKDLEKFPREEYQLEFYIIDFFREFWVRAFDFTGKTRRKEFWLTILTAFILYFLIFGLPISFYVFAEINNSQDVVATSSSLSKNISYLSWLIAIVNLIPSLSIQVRRLNDIGKDPGWVLLSFVPLISFLLIFWYSKPSFRKQSTLGEEQSTSLRESFLNDLDNVEERLLKLKSMVDKGLISNKEYEELRKKTLGL